MSATAPNMTVIDGYLILSLLPGLGPVRVRRLISALGGAERVLAASRSELLAVPGIGEEIADTIRSWSDHADPETERRAIRDHGVTILSQECDEYPACLREIHNAPVLLYVKGKIDPRDRHAIGVVGSRKATHYGREATRKLSFQLAHAGMTIVSGLARGIDTAAHEAALAANGRTLAVLGGGIGKLFPAENAALAEKISDGHGAVISEFPMNYTPDKQSFPLRNRIISGLSVGVLVTEAPNRSGALITVAQALEQGRSVYAVPGPIDRPTSVGCNQLIQQGAKLVMTARDILEDLESLFPYAGESPEIEVTRPALQLSSEEQGVYDALGDRETQIETVIARSGLPSSVVSSTLLRLEMKQLVKQLPGKYFVKLL